MKIHIVKKGDTLYELSKKHNVELQDLIAFNPQIANPDQIDVGMKVKIPVSPKPVEPPSSEYVHKHIVQQGDSLWKLGKAWDVPLQAMIQTNTQLKNPNVLMTGEIVYIPKIGTEAPHGPTLMETPSIFGAPHALILNEAPSNSGAPSEPGIPAVPVPANFEMPEAPAAMTPSEIPGLSAAPNLSFAPMAEGIFPLQADTTVPLKSMSDMPKGDKNDAPVMPEMDTSQPDAVHPFSQFQVPATEAFVPQYPSPFAVAPDIPGLPPMSWGMNEFPPASYPPVPYPSAAFPTEAMYPGASTGGDCGCGGSSMMPVFHEPWASNPVYPAYTSGMANPYYPALPMPPMDMMNHGYPGPFMGSFPHTGMNPWETPYPVAFEAPSIPPHAHIHQLVEEDQNEELLRSANTVNKSAASAKKNKPSGASAVSAYVRKVQNRDRKPEPKPNIPWINV